MVPFSSCMYSSCAGHPTTQPHWQLSHRESPALTRSVRTPHVTGRKQTDSPVLTYLCASKAHTLLVQTFSKLAAKHVATACKLAALAGMPSSSSSNARKKPARTGKHCVEQHMGRERAGWVQGVEITGWMRALTGWDEQIRLVRGWDQ